MGPIALKFSCESHHSQCYRLLALVGLNTVSRFVGTKKSCNLKALARVRGRLDTELVAQQFYPEKASQAHAKSGVVSRSPPSDPSFSQSAGTATYLRRSEPRPDSNETPIY